MDRERVNSLVAMMESDHRRQHALLGRIGQSLEEGYVDQVQQALAEFALRLYKHIKIENSLLAPALGMPARPESLLASQADLQAEHAEIMAKLALVEMRLEERAELPRISAAWQDFALFFVHHEQEEEQYLFPYWQRALGDLPEGDSATLFRRVREAHQTAF